MIFNMKESNSSITRGGPLVSVIIPAYNAAGYIKEAVESVLAQTYRDQEIIVIDDGSTDSTAACVSTAFGDSVVVIRQSNGGPSSARNCGIEAAKGKYIAFLDADDTWFPDKISEQVNLMERYPDVGMVFGNAVTLKDGIKAEKSHFEQEGLDEAYFGDPIYYKEVFKKLFHKNIIMTQTVMVRASVLEKTGGFNADFRFGEDFLLWLDIARVTKIAYQAKAVAFRRRHYGNLTNDPEKPILNKPRVLKEIKNKHEHYLKKLKIDIDYKLAQSWFQIGCFKFYSDSLLSALRPFSKSLKYRFTFHCFLYFLLSVTGIGFLLKIKNNINI